MVDYALDSVSAHQACHPGSESFNALCLQLYRNSGSAEAAITLLENLFNRSHQLLFSSGSQAT
jgi:hypothetical protein